MGKQNKKLIEKIRGFTIVELLIVVVVIAILAAITIVAFNGIQQRAVSSALQSDLSSAVKKLKLYQIDNNYYPTSIDPVTHCPVPADVQYCLSVSTGHDLINYSVNNATNPQTFTLDVVHLASGVQYYATNEIGPTLAGNSATIAAITGTTTTGSTLTAGAVSPGGATVNRQWQRSTTAGGTYTDVAGATNNTYVLLTTDIGYYFRVQITGTGSYTGVSTSAASALVTTTVTAVGTPTGTTTVGSTLTAGARTPAAATVSYQWRRGVTNIAGATASTYVATSTDINNTLSVVVTGTGNYSGTATSGNTAIITTPITAIAVPTGTTTVGQTLTVGARTPAAATATYQWRRDGVNISSATATTYVLQAADAGTLISVVATGTSGYTGTVTSPNTAAIAP